MTWVRRRLLDIAQQVHSDRSHFQSVPLLGRPSVCRRPICVRWPRELQEAVANCCPGWGDQVHSGPLPPASRGLARSFLSPQAPAEEARALYQQARGSALHGHSARVASSRAQLPNAQAWNRACITGGPGSKVGAVAAVPRAWLRSPGQALGASCAHDMSILYRCKHPAPEAPLAWPPQAPSCPPAPPPVAPLHRPQERPSDCVACSPATCSPLLLAPSPSSHNQHRLTPWGSAGTSPHRRLCCVLAV